MTSSRRRPAGAFAGTDCARRTATNHRFCARLACGCCVWHVDVATVLCATDSRRVQLMNRIPKLGAIRQHMSRATYVMAPHCPTHTHVGETAPRPHDLGHCRSCTNG